METSTVFLQSRGNQATWSGDRDVVLRSKFSTLNCTDRQEECMGWWKTGGTESVIGDEPLDVLGAAASEVVKQYETAFGRRPTIAEWDMGSATSGRAGPRTSRIQVRGRWHTHGSSHYRAGMTAGDGHDSWWWSDHTSATGNTTASPPRRKGSRMGAAEAAARARAGR